MTLGEFYAVLPEIVLVVGAMALLMVGAYGGELRTTDGRAEVLLTPGVFLRVGQRSTIRMVASALPDTQVELENGAIAVEAGEQNLHTSVTLLYKDWRVHLLRKGVYRVDSDPPRLWVMQGKADVFASGSEQPTITVDQGMSLPFAAVLVPEASLAPGDALTEWANGRNQSISADNAITAQLGEDPLAGAGASGFTYFPVLGVPPSGLTTMSTYGAYPPMQPGFYSIYLPGYTYMPLLVGLGLGRLGGTGIGTLGRPYVPLVVPRPLISPAIGGVPRPLTLGAPGAGRARTAPFGGARGGGHR